MPEYSGSNGSADEADQFQHVERRVNKDMATVVCGVERRDYEDEIFRHHLVGLSMVERGQLLTALHLIRVFHDEQVRDSGEPYDRHVLTAADKARQAGYDLITIIQCLLLDSIEDCKSPSLDVEAIIRHEMGAIGDEIADDILVVTKSHRGENMAQKILEAVMRGRWRPAVVKLFDRDDNIDTIDGIRDKQTGIQDRARIIRKLDETRTVIIPCLVTCAPHIPRPHQQSYMVSCTTLAEKTIGKLARYQHQPFLQLALDST